MGTTPPAELTPQQGPMNCSGLQAGAITVKVEMLSRTQGMLA
ncbi:hypothetical protein SAMN06265219_10734 [Gracilimonas mengyeensis]|uniref:Uncharacterized protein n=1 Tax=Gracilimonas mengyeensis TaxID=1302730 RepID=A0A521D1H5_9BACT|nr:hypothetical protein SAMN06265219_10734 [Gracilimonas mengyeensis]